MNILYSMHKTKKNRYNNVPPPTPGPRCLSGCGRAGGGGVLKIIYMYCIKLIVID